MIQKFGTLINLLKKMGRPFGQFRFFGSIVLYLNFFRDYIKYKNKSLPGELRIADLTPMLSDKTSHQPFDQHYFYQGIWAYKKISKKSPENHIDVGGQIDMVGYLTTLVNVTYVDIRPLLINLENFKCVQGSILDMPFEDNSVKSLSCLHVAEHIGLGRYGDPIDPDGTMKACKELSRVLAKGGDLYFSMPVGKQKTCFNAHRIHAPLTILEYFKELTLVELSGVADGGNFVVNVGVSEFRDSNYATGFFHFRKL